MHTTDLYELIKTLAPVSPEGVPGAGPGDGERSGEGGAQDAAEVVALVRALARGSAPVTESSRRAVPPAMRSQGSEGSRIADAIGRSLVTGLAIPSLFKGLFGGGSSRSEPAPALPQFELPQAIHEEIGYDSEARRFTGTSYGADGLQRRVPAQAAPITVNVQAMDSRSFLDHSHEIARAVREAVLTSGSLSDVLTDL